MNVLLDIEGTTTPIRFVHDVLFPYVRARLPSVEIPEATAAALKAEHDRDPEGLPWTGPIPYVLWLMDRDRKSTALKELQGKIWQQGYGCGDLRGEVFPDVPPALKTWHENGVDIRIFSSGSVLAQTLLFSSTPAGDLTRFLRGYFDTTTGPKAAAGSYASIAASFSQAPSDILFVSDTTVELDAARQAGMATLLCVRPGNPPQPSSTHRRISTFDEVTPDRSSRRE